MRNFFLSAVALLSLSAQNAFAVSLTFQFDVNSSGPSMYACNAGIKHGQETKICYDKVNGATCTPACATGDVNACAANTSPATCACTGEEGAGNQGGTFMDFANVNYGEWSDNQSASTAPNNKKLSSFGYDWTSLFPMTTGAYANQVRDLTINLGSEIYGAEYFVDICYRGSQIDYSNVPSLNFGLIGKVTVTNLKTGTNYQDLSKLNVQAETKCIMQDSFDYCSADSIPGLNLCGSTAIHTVIQTSAVTPAYASAQQIGLLDRGTMGAGSSRAPKFCYTRYTFSEKSHVVRKWKEQKARICTYTRISEPSESESSL
ncbi:MAG: hypothetical protein PHY93_08320 [Bacteriovorax sp.]|nr:hypothetical protein [Bacteriovorax sp.]